MLSARAELTVGLIPQGGTDWIAGVVYLDNIVRAVDALDGSRPELCWIAGPGDRLRGRDDMKPDLPVHSYTHRPGDSWWTAIRNSLKSHRAPQTLDTLLARVGVSVLFPLMVPPVAPLPVSWVGWIPDFQHKRRPEFFSPAERAFRETCFQRIVNEASHIIVSSQDAREDLMRWFPTTRARVSVLQFRTVLDRRWYDLDPDIATAPLQLPSKYLTYPSQLWIHKNHRTVFAALSLLRERGRSDVVLVCTGREYDYRHPEYANELKAEIARHGLQSHVRLLGLLDRRTQIQVMRKSAAVVQASLFEGWSALVEDARALGKPIFLSDIPVHREQAPSRATYFDPESAEELAGAIENEWPHLEPGPALESERQAREEQQPLILDFARRFVDVICAAGAVQHNGT